jgi:hypothetical protein
MRISLRARSVRTVCSFIVIVAFTAALRAGDTTNPYLGSWALTLPNGAAGWLGVTEKNGKLAGSILWAGGSVLPVDSIKVEGDALVINRVQKGKGGMVTTETITGKADGDEMKLTTVKSQPQREAEFAKAEFTGKRTPPPPAAPDLSKVKFGEPITLFNGKDLEGWRRTDPKADNGWTVHDGILTNGVEQEPGKAHKHFGNLRTDREFEDFHITLETNVPKGGNSGVYLRGIYEVQVLDSYGKPLDSHNMGAIYSRICPTESAEKPAGEWQTMDITLVDRHATVILNGKRIIDNQPILGCTGGALWSDPFRPGPIYLQGDHTGANFRNIVLRPVVKE